MLSLFVLTLVLSAAIGVVSPSMVVFAVETEQENDSGSKGGQTESAETETEFKANITNEMRQAWAGEFETDNALIAGKIADKTATQAEIDDYNTKLNEFLQLKEQEEIERQRQQAEENAAVKTGNFLENVLGMSLKDIFLTLARGTIMLGGHFLSWGIDSWAKCMEVVFEYLQKKPSATSGYTLVTESGADTVYGIMTAIGVALCFIFYYLGHLKAVLDVRMELSLEGATKILIRLVLSVGIVISSMTFIEGFVDVGSEYVAKIGMTTDEMPSVKLLNALVAPYTGVTVDTKEVEEELDAEFQDTDGTGEPESEKAQDDSDKEKESEAESEKTDDKSTSDSEETEDAEDIIQNVQRYQYFVAVYYHLKETDASVGTWLATAAICMFGGAIAGVVVLVCGIKIITAVLGRLFRILMILPFAPIAFASIAGGPGYTQMLKTFVKTLITYALEAIVILLSVNIAYAMFDSTASMAQAPSGNVVMETIFLLINLTLPVTCAVTFSQGAEQVIARILGNT